MTPRFPIDGVNYRSDEEKRRHLANGAWLPITAGHSLRDAAAEVPDKPAVIAEDGSYTFPRTRHLVGVARRRSDRSRVAAGRPSGVPDRSGEGNFRQRCSDASRPASCRSAHCRNIVRSRSSRSANERAPLPISCRAMSPRASTRSALPARCCSAAAIKHLFVTRGMRTMRIRSKRLQANTIAKAAREIVRPHDPSPDDVIMFQLSGGSTGLPKIIPRFHSEYLGSALWLAKAYQLDGDDIGMWALPLIHNAGMLFTVIPTAVTRRTNVILSSFDVEKFLAAIPRHKVTFTGSIGPVAPRIMEYPRIGDHDLSSLRQFFALSRADALEGHTGIVSGNMFGITEGLLIASAPSDPEELRHRGCGRRSRRAMKSAC